MNRCRLGWARHRQGDRPLFLSSRRQCSQRGLHQHHTCSPWPSSSETSVARCARPPPCSAASRAPRRRTARPATPAGRPGSAAVKSAERRRSVHSIMYCIRLLEVSSGCKLARRMRLDLIAMVHRGRRSTVSSHRRSRCMQPFRRPCCRRPSSHHVITNDQTKRNCHHLEDGELLRPARQLAVQLLPRRHRVLLAAVAHSVLRQKTGPGSGTADTAASCMLSHRTHDRVYPF